MAYEGTGFSYDGEFTRRTRASGATLKPDGSPAHTRISAGIIIMEYPTMQGPINLHGVAIYNPNAEREVPEHVLKGIGQLVRRGDKMEWADDNP